MKNIKPLSVSPLIKSVRWSLLFLGVIYGAHRYPILKRYEEGQVSHRLKILEDIRVAEVLKKKEENEIFKKSLCNDFGYEYDPSEWKDV